MTPPVQLSLLAEPAPTQRLASLVDLRRQITAVSWRLSQGADGLGRARASLVLPPGSTASWAGAFPGNPFHVPVLITGSGESISTAMGLLVAQMEAALESIRLVRSARLEIDPPADRTRQLESIRHLGWSQLSEAERLLCPPLLVIGEESQILGQDLSALVDGLASPLPLKVVVLSALDYALASSRLPFTGTGDELPVEATLDENTLLSLGHEDTFILQSSISSPNHLAQGLVDALAHPGPALIRIHTPSPERHGFPTEATCEQALRAMESRAFPLLRYDPNGEGVFGTRIDILDNPGLEVPWHKDDQGRAVDLARWAATESRFAHLFTAVSSPGPTGVPLLEYLDLPAYSRPGKRAYVEGGSSLDSEYLLLSDAMVALVERRLRAWQTLQELAGWVTPFTQRVHEQVELELLDSHEAEIAAMEAEHSAHIDEIEQEMEQEIVSRVQESLMTLAGVPPLPREPEDA